MKRFVPEVQDEFGRHLVVMRDLNKLPSCKSLPFKPMGRASRRTGRLPSATCSIASAKVANKLKFFILIGQSKLGPSGSCLPLKCARHRPSCLSVRKIRPTLEPIAFVRPKDKKSLTFQPRDNASDHRGISASTSLKEGTWNNVRSQCSLLSSRLSR